MKKNVSSFKYRELKIRIEFCTADSLLSINNYMVNKNKESCFGFNEYGKSQSNNNFIFQVLTYCHFRSG